MWFSSLCFLRFKQVWVSFQCNILDMWVYTTSSLQELSSEHRISVQMHHPKDQHQRASEGVFSRLSWPREGRSLRKPAEQVWFPIVRKRLFPHVLTYVLIATCGYKTRRVWLHGLCVSYFTHCSDQMPDKSNSMEERVIFLWSSAELNFTSIEESKTNGTF